VTTSARAQNAGEYDPFTHTCAGDPYPLYRRMRDQGSVWRAGDLWALTRFDDVQAAARNWQTFSHAAGVDLDEVGALIGTGNFLDADPPPHDRLRDIVRREFQPKAISALEPTVRAEARRMLDAMPDHGRVDVASSFGWPLPVGLVHALIGFPSEDREHLQRLLSVFSLRGVERPSGDRDLPGDAVAAGSELRAYCGHAIASHGDSPGILRTLAAAVRRRKLTVDEATGTCFLLLLAGVDTTTSLITNSIYHLAARPAQRGELVAPGGIEPAVVEELLRFDSPIQADARTTTGAISIGGTEIPEGARVLLIFGSANRDERRFREPDRLDFAREPKRHLAFGEGIHHCLGAPLARMEGRVALEEFLARVPDYEVAGEPTRMPSQTTRGFDRLEINY
jgi:cytochrome P450